MSEPKYPLHYNHNLTTHLFHGGSFAVGVVAMVGVFDVVDVLLHNGVSWRTASSPTRQTYTRLGPCVATDR